MMQRLIFLVLLFLIGMPSQAMDINGFLKSACLENLPADPTPGCEGRLYYNTTTNIPYLYADSSWIELGSGSGPAPIPELLRNVAVEQWQIQPAALSGLSSQFLTDVAWSGDLRLFAAVTTGSTGIMTSPDGVTWTAQTGDDSSNRRSIVWGSELGLFATVASDGATSGVEISSDGITWADQTTPNSIWTGITYSPSLERFVAVASSGTNRVMYSDDGTTWTAATAAEANQWQSVTWAPALNLFVAVSSTGTNRVMTSPDGITWTSESAAEANAWQEVDWSEELSLFAAVANTGTNRIMTSPDGETWTAVAAPSALSWTGIAWGAGPGVFAATATDGTGRDIMTSTDGVTWVLRHNPQLGVTWNKITYAHELTMFASVGTATSVGAVLTSGAGLRNPYNPLTATGSLVVGDVSGIPTEEPIGALGKFLRVLGGTVSWLWQETTSAKSADYPITDTDGISVILMTTGGTDRTITLPVLANNQGRRFTFKKVDSGTGFMIVDGDAANIEGAATQTIYKQYGEITVVAGATEWNLLSPIEENFVYTPTSFDGSNVTSSTPGPCQVNRFKNTVTVYCYTAVDAITQGETTNLDISLPITTNLINTTDLLGSGGVLSSANDTSSAVTVSTDSVNERATLNYICGQTASQNLRYSFIYPIQ